MAKIVYCRTDLLGGSYNDVDGIDGSILNDGDLCIVATGTVFYLYQLDADSGLTESSPDIIAPDSNPGDKRWILQRQPTNNSVPEGSIIAWLGGYFTASGNGGTYTNVLGTANTIAAVNTLLNADGWHVCNGAALNLGTSTIFNGSGRYLPDLTDNRFIQGGSDESSMDLPGVSGGASSSAHTHSHYHSMQGHTHSLNSHTHSMQAHQHSVPSHTLTIGEIPSHAHNTYFLNPGAASGTYDGVDSTEYVMNKDTVGYVALGSGAGGGGGHDHGITSGPDSANTGASSGSTGIPNIGNTDTKATAASASENRPQFLSCFYIMKVIP